MLLFFLTQLWITIVVEFFEKGFVSFYIWLLLSFFDEILELVSSGTPLWKLICLFVSLSWDIEMLWGSFSFFADCRLNLFTYELSWSIRLRSIKISFLPSCYWIYALSAIQLKNLDFFPFSSLTLICSCFAIFDILLLLICRENEDEGYKS
jgi:hypothetical protein